MCLILYFLKNKQKKTEQKQLRNTRDFNEVLQSCLIDTDAFVLDTLTMSSGYCHVISCHFPTWLMTLSSK